MIPLAKDVAGLVGDFAEGIDNRSLLYEKFAFPKVWGQPEKANDAGRWSVLRIVTRGSDLLKADATRLRYQASGRNVNPDRADGLRRQAALAEKLANIARPDATLAHASARNTKKLLADLEHSFTGVVVAFEATLGGRLLVNLAGGVVENAGVNLDRCFGLPFIPGSAVKGVARAQALWEIHEAPAADRQGMLRQAMLLFGFGAQDLRRDGVFAWAAGKTLGAEAARAFGAEDFKGLASFLPAYPTTPPVLVVDMVNPHYPDYYRGGRLMATDDEDPIPNYFPAVETGSGFGFAVLLNRLPPDVSIAASDLLKAARGWIERALTQKGAGAKTAAGYGWFTLGAPKPKPIPIAAGKSSSSAVAAEAPASPADAFIQKWRGKLNTRDNFPVALPEMLALSADTDLRRAFEAVVPETDRKKLKKNHSYWQSFTSGKHAEAGKKILHRLGIKLT